MGSGRRNLGRTWGCASCSSDRAGNETPRNDQYAETPAKQNTQAKTKGDAFFKPSNMVSINNLNKQKTHQNYSNFQLHVKIEDIVITLE